jgi:hypothetical protein
MAKKKRLVVGSIWKGRDGKPDYIKINNDVVLTKGQFVNLESKAQKIKSLEDAIQAGRLSGDGAQKMLQNARDMNEGIRFELYVLQDV